LAHTCFYLAKSYDYNNFVEKRKAFIYTLEEARKSGNECEKASITKDIAYWNTELARLKYDNSTIMIDQYVDDRFDKLDFIK